MVLPTFGAVLCLWFRKSNPVFCFLISMALFYFGDDASLTQIAAGYMLIPIFWMIFTISEERGILNPTGFSKGLSLLSCGLIIATLGYPANDLGIFANLWIDLHYAIQWRPSWGGWMPLPAPALGSFALATLVLTVKVIRKHRPMDLGYLGGLVALFGAALKHGEPSASLIFISLASLLLVLGLFQESHRMAFLDELTSIPGRRALLADMKKLGRHYSLAMVDIDFFKKFNDTHGHDVGDQVLRMVSSRLSQTGGGSRAYRYGGEEFTLLFPGKSIDEALDYLEDVRERIQDTIFVIRGTDRPQKKPSNSKKKITRKRPEGKQTKVTISIGLSERTDKQEEPSDVMKKADRALYKAKDKGRNCVITK
ncbi:GGDEF domain-containing protein [Kiloniella antarctica]